MTISLKCAACKSALRVPESYAGKKVKCPKCQAALAVPAAEDDEVVAEVVADDGDDREDRVADAPKRKPAARRRDEEDEDDRRESVREGRKRAPDRDEEDDRGRGKDKRRRRRDEDDDRGRPGKRYKPCPRCGEEDARKVAWTWWGSFYGPAMFTHVRCLGCGHCYNGRTGGSNAIPATIFFVVPLLGILGVIGAIFWLLHRAGYI